MASEFLSKLLHVFIYETEKKKCNFTLLMNDYNILPGSAFAYMFPLIYP